MNQTLKDRFYSIGTKRHIKYVAAAGGMTAEDELQHAAYLHELAVCEIDQLRAVFKSPPPSMMDSWEAEHKAYVEKAAWIKQMLSM